MDDGTPIYTPRLSSASYIHVDQTRTPTYECLQGHLVLLIQNHYFQSS